MVTEGWVYSLLGRRKAELFETIGRRRQNPRFEIPRLFVDGVVECLPSTYRAVGPNWYSTDMKSGFLSVKVRATKSDHSDFNIWSVDPPECTSQS
jgi:hypothetical protein